MTLGGVNEPPSIRYSQIHIHSLNHSTGLLFLGLPAFVPPHRSDRSMKDEIDLGDGHRMVFSDYKGEKRVAANIIHPPVEGKCFGDGYISFEGRSWANEFTSKNIPTWKVEQDEPITLSPSVLCRACGDHGFVVNGKWVKA